MKIHKYERIEIKMAEKRMADFIREYAAAINRGDAAAFLGAGMSVPSGFVDWKGLLSGLAEEIGLSVEKEQDLLAVAQYYVNEKNNRVKVSQTIKNEFSLAKQENKSIAAFSKLDIRTVWTTNYDHVIEEAYESAGKRVDVKKSNADLVLYDEDASVCIYKMHGDVSCPEDTVLLKDEYENFFNLRKGFVTTLKGHLLSKTFLFVGYRFADPDINSILSWIRQLSEGSHRCHYWITRRVKEEDEDYQYLLGKQELIINDLKRYGIETVLVDDYSEIPMIFDNLYREYNRKNIFISGSCACPPDSWTEHDVDEFVSCVAEKLVDSKMCISSGYGLGVGSSVISGALRAINRNKYAHFDKYLKLYPFPQNLSDPQKEWNAYRHHILEKCGVVIFMFGNKKDKDENIVIANGVISEYEIAQANNLILIPLAFTGYAAEEVYNLMLSEKQKYPYLEEFWSELTQKHNVEETIKMISKILKNVGGKI